jgi:hypothetical protein
MPVPLFERIGILQASRINIRRGPSFGARAGDVIIRALDIHSQEYARNT